jgi:electron transport complex protein RnfD
MIMLEVCLAGLPGAAMLGITFGAGVWINLLAAITFALAFESGMLWLRSRDIKYGLADGSALVTGFLLGVALPPTSPWWLVAIGIFAAIVVAKHLYGGLGHNPFNPAMIGYLILLISFPVEMTRWLPPETLAADTALHSLSGAFSNFIGMHGATSQNPLSTETYSNLDAHLTVDAYVTVDAFTAATGLDALKTARGQLLSPEEALTASPTLIQVGNTLLSAGWHWPNLFFCCGGIYLLWRKHISWHIPMSVLGTLGLCALLGSTIAPMTGGVSFHLLAGATMLGAFFIATDPVSAATSTRGKLLFGAGIGLITYIIRVLGGYPDAIAFAVVLMNICVPTIDYYTRPRTYGHAQAKSGWGN